MRKSVFACTGSIVAKLAMVACSLVLGGSVVAGDVIAPVPLGDVDCPTTLGSCTANEVQTTVVAAEPVGDDSCTSPLDTIEVILTLGISSNSDRYDFSVFVAQDGGKLNTSQGVAATAADCAGVASQVGGGEGVGSTGFFLDLDSTMSEADTCGDVNTIPEQTPLLWKVQTTVDCVQSATDEYLIIEACRVWSQNNVPGCTDLSGAGTGSKCDCTPLEVTDIPVPTDPCLGNTCDDGMFCNGEETCNPTTGECVSGQPINCDDGFFCNGMESCDENTDQCVSSGDPCGDDGTFCNGDESCDEDANQCVSSGDPCGDDGEFCNGDESCDEAADQCVSAGDPCGDDGEFCNGDESCDEAADQCVSAGDPCGDDGTFCNGDESCDETADQCVSSGNPCDAGSLPTCDGTVACDDLDDECVCATDVCRTAGFWGTHDYVTDAMLDWANMDTPIEVCGVEVYDFSCAVEGLCSRPRGNKQLITARQLLATALSCHLSSGSGDCTGSEVETLFASCNAACESNDKRAMADCTPQLDCYVNGGQTFEDVGCATGYCSVDQAALCGADAGSCAFVNDGDGNNANECVPFAGNCHDQLLVNELLGFDFEPPGPADPTMCQDAKRSQDDLFDSAVCPQM